MNAPLRFTLAVLAGLVTAVLLIAGIEFMGHRIYPPPADLDISNIEQFAAFVNELPVGALLIVIAAWLTATFIGGLVACVIAGSRPMLVAGIIGAVLLFASIGNLLMIAHPKWFSLSAFIGIVASTFLAGRVGAMWQRREG